MKIWPIINGFLANPKLVTERVSRSFWASDSSFTYELDGRKVHVGGCRRAQYYRFMQYPQDQRGIEFSNLWVMTLGNHFEDLLGNELKLAGMFLGKEVEVHIVRTLPDGGQYRISGRMDYLILNPNTGEPEIVECKSTAGYMAAGVVTPSKTLGYAPKPEHLLQTLIYLVWLGLPNQGSIQNPKANLVYITRDGETGEHEVYLDKTDGHVIIENSAGIAHWNHLKIDMVFAAYDELYFALRDGKVPDRDYELTWSRETILWKLAHGDLNKTDTASVESKVKTGFAGPLLDKGDWPCAYCHHQKGCYAPYPGFGPKNADEVTTFFLPQPIAALPAATGVHVAGLPS